MINAAACALSGMHLSNTLCSTCSAVCYALKHLKNSSLCIAAPEQHLSMHTNAPAGQLNAVQLLVRSVGLPPPPPGFATTTKTSRILFMIVKCWPGSRHQRGSNLRQVQLCSCCDAYAASEASKICSEDGNTHMVP